MKDKQINIALVDDHGLFREGMEYLINKESDMQVTFSSGEGKNLLKHLTGTQDLPDVLLLDLQMKEMNGREVLQQVKTSYPEIRVLMLSMFRQEEYILSLLDLGANGYLFKDSRSEEVLTAIRKVHQSGFYFGEAVARAMHKGRTRTNPVIPSQPESLFKNQVLTRREEEILAFIADEKTTQEIADALHISYRTVETHRKNLLEKLECRNTAGLVYKALKIGLLKLK